MMIIRYDILHHDCRKSSSLPEQQLQTSPRDSLVEIVKRYPIDPSGVILFEDIYCSRDLKISFLIWLILNPQHENHSPGPLFPYRFFGMQSQRVAREFRKLNDLQY